MGGDPPDRRGFWMVLIWIVVMLAVLVGVVLAAPTSEFDGFVTN